MNETRHEYSLKTLVDVHFTEEKNDSGTISRICPSCKKGLTNGLKAMRASSFPFSSCSHKGTGANCMS